jgi:capsular exopolysaccharide synthesis family protein
MNSEKPQALPSTLSKPTIIDQSSTAVNEEESGLDISKILGTVRRKAWLIGVAAIATSAFMGFQAAKQTPQFQGKFSLLVEPVVQRKQISSSLTDEKGGDTVKEFDYSTQIQVLISPQTLRPIIKKINGRYSDVNYDQINGKLVVTRLGETKIIEVQYSGTDPAKVKFILEELSKGYLNYSIEDQKATLLQGIKFIDRELPTLQERVNSLQERIQTLRQHYHFVDPDSYAQELSGQLKTIAQQRQNIRTQLAALQTQYAALQQQAGASAALENAGFYQEFLKQFQALDRQIAIESARFGENNPTIILLKQQQDNLEPLLQQEAERSLHNQSATVYNNMQILSNQDRQLATLEKLLDEAFQQTPAISRQFVDLQRELKTSTESLSRFQNTRESLQIQAAQNEVPWQLIAPPKEPESQVASNTYKSLMTGAMGGLVLGAALAFFLEKAENAFYTIADLKKKTKLPILGIIPYRANLDSAGSEVHVVDLRALQPNSDQSIKAHATALKEQMKSLLHQDLSNGVNNGKSYETGEEFSLPGLPTQDNKLSLDDQDTYDFIEAFRSLHTSITRLSDQPITSIVISSATPVEGRTTVAVHLAQAAAAMGRRVLLVDAHLRQGSVPIHSLFGLPDQLGLGDFLLESATLNQIIQRLVWEPSLFVVGVGSIPLDPTRLLASTQMQAFMQRVHKTFDLVIYDTLPLMGLADVSLLAAQTDGVILVTGFGKRGGAEAFSQTLERLKVSQIPVLGVVANGVKDYSVDWYSR